MTFDVVIKSIKWSLLDRVFSAVSQFAIGILIARVLLPRDYGLISMLAFFMYFCGFYYSNHKEKT